MKPDESPLDREHRNLSRITALIYLGGGLLFVVALGLIMRMSEGSAFGPAQWILGGIWLAALAACAWCADRGLWVYRLLNEWEESIEKRRKLEKRH